MTRGTLWGKYRLLFNAAANWSSFALQVVVTFLISPILVHGLGNSRYGIWSMIESILAYLFLFEFGVSASLVRYVARFESVRDRDRLDRIFSTAMVLFVLAGVAVLAATAVITGFFWSHLNIPVEFEAESRWLMWQLGVNLALSLPMNIYASILDGLEQYCLKHSIRSATLIARSLGVLYVVRTGGGLVALGWVLIASTVIENLAMTVATYALLPALRFRPWSIDRESLRAVGSYSAHAFLVLVANRVSFGTDAIVIGLCLSPDHVAWFVTAGRLIEYGKNFFRSLTTVLTPAFSGLEARGGLTAIRSLFLDSSRYLLWLAVPFQLGFMILGYPFLSLWLGDNFAEMGAPVLAILAVPFTLSVAQSINSRVLYGTGRLAVFSWLSLAEAGLNLVLSLALVRVIGLAGVAWGTTIPSLMMCAALAVAMCRLLDVPFPDYARRLFLTPSLAGVVPAVLWIAARQWLGFPSWAHFLAIGVGGVAVYGCLFLVIEEDGRRLVVRAVGRLGRGSASLAVHQPEAVQVTCDRVVVEDQEPAPRREMIPAE